MKIPKKKELLRLQAKHRTDRKIGKALGGVPAHLVAYWRKKKNIPSCDLPKYSLKQIKNLWETWGSDKQAAAQLGISPAAFYKWRQRYKLKDKPRLLKFSHLQLNLFGKDRSFNAGSGHTLVEKIVSLKKNQGRAVAGQSFQLEPDLIVISSGWEELFRQCDRLGFQRAKRADHIWAVLPTPADDGIGSVAQIEGIRKFLKQKQIKNTLCRKDGHCLQLLWEKSLICPLGIAVGTEALMAAAGFAGCWGQPIDSFSLAQLLESGKIWLEIPASLRVELKGEVRPGVFAADIYAFLAEQLDAESAGGKLIEFGGETVERLSLTQRMNLSLLFAQKGSWNTLFSVDYNLRKVLGGQIKRPVSLTGADQNAGYADRFEFHLSHLEPLVSSDLAPKKVASVRQQRKRSVSQIILSIELNGGLEDLETACRILSKRKIHPEVRFYVIPPSRLVYLSALKKGYLRTLFEAGAIICDPGLTDLQHQLSPAGPILSTSRLNFNHGRLFQHQETILVSPGTAAASALKGEITDPRDYL
jgi:3-isopropylmalate/(R)-2-methylmalate dehydratase large subunit